SRYWIMPQTRDMNPVYTGKDVSYADTKLAARAGETAVLEGERLSTLAWLAGAAYPAESLDKAWRQLAYGAHHDAITGTESDQVYLDLLGGWREAWQRGHDARQAAAGYLAGLGGTGTDAPAGATDAVVVFNTLARARSAMASITLAPAGPGIPSLLDDAGQPVPCLADAVSRGDGGGIAEVTLTFRAADVPALGYRTYRIVPGLTGPGSQA